MSTTINPTPQMSNILETARSKGDFTVLIQAIEAAGLSDTFKSEGPFTVFAPNDEAFKKLPAGTLDGLLKDLPKLKGILSYHVIDRKITMNEIPQILAESHKRFYTSLVTNGWLLKQRIQEIGDYLEFLFVSLDGLGSLHDKLRGTSGSFDKAIIGIKAARDYGARVAINSTITRENIHQVEGMVRLAKGLGVGVNFQPAYDYSTADSLSPYGEKLLNTLLKLLDLKKSDAPLVNSREYLSTIIESWYHGVPWRCKPWLTINIDPQGRIVLPCYTLQEYNRDSNSYTDHVWNTDILKLWNSYNWEQYEGCNKCALSCYLEPSLFSWTKPGMIKDRIVDSMLSSSGIHF